MTFSYKKRLHKQTQIRKNFITTTIEKRKQL